jgi:hypothetical protein
MNSEQAKQILVEKYSAYRQGKSEIESINSGVKEKKTTIDKYEKEIIEVMLRGFNKSCIDISGQGAGPWITVDKHKSEPTLKEEDLVRLFSSFIDSWRRNEQLSAEQMVERYREEKKRGEKRNLKLSTRVRRPDGDGSSQGVLEWVNGQ